MKYRDLFILLIKIFGLYSAIIALFTIIPQQVPFLIYDDWSSDASIYLLSMVSLTIIFFLMLLFLAPTIVNSLQLDKKFSSDEIDFGNLNEESIVKVCSFIVGGFTIIYNLPTLIGQTLTAIRAQNMLIEDGGNDFLWISSLIHVAIGFYLVFNYEMIYKLLAKKEPSDNPL